MLPLNRHKKIGSGFKITRKKTVTSKFSNLLVLIGRVLIMKVNIVNKSGDLKDIKPGLIIKRVCVFQY